MPCPAVEAEPKAEVMGMQPLTTEESAQSEATLGEKEASWMTDWCAKQWEDADLEKLIRWKALNS